MKKNDVRFIVLTIVIALMLAALSYAHSTPTISRTSVMLLNDGVLTVDNDNYFAIAFEPGVVHACTVFKMVEVTEDDRQLWPDGRYAPRSCSLILPTSSGYTDNWSEFIYNVKTGKPYDVDWEVYAEIWYAASETPLETNRLLIHR